jgi:host factor-I protein
VNRKLFRPSLMEPKDPYSSRQSQGQGQPQSQSLGAAAAPRKKPIPPEQTFAESFYFVKQMQARTPVAVILTDGEVLRGILEWYDRDCIKLTRIGSPNLLIYKHAIKYLYKDGEEAALGGATG